MTLEKKTLSFLGEALQILESGFKGLPEFVPRIDLDGIKGVLMDVAKRMQENYPYPHPMYIGQMLKPPHPMARLAYMLSLWINPNNHALDGGRCSSAMEKEAVAQIAGMFGWKSHLGHLCGGGTLANMEALWISGSLFPGKKIVASQQAHYTHQRLCGVLGIAFEAIPCDSKGRMNMKALEKALANGDIGTVVATIGTTATGSVDPLQKILELRERYPFRIHADAAYGGYFILSDNLYSETKAAYDCLGTADSIVIDPHKHGLQPYGCGCVLFRDASVGRFYKHDSPYTYFTSRELHLGEISLECSRAGASAVALWATQRLLPLVPGGAFAADLARCRKAALAFYARLEEDSRFLTAFAPELDIVIWAPKRKRASEASNLAAELFDAAAEENLHMAKANLPKSLFMDYWPDFEWDQEHLTCLRSCFMKPEHLEWIERIYAVLDKATNRVLKGRTS